MCQEKNEQAAAQGKSLLGKVFGRRWWALLAAGRRFGKEGFHSLQDLFLVHVLFDPEGRHFPAVGVKEKEGGDSSDAVPMKNLILMRLAARQVQPEGQELPAQLNDLRIGEDFPVQGPARSAPVCIEVHDHGPLLPRRLGKNRFLVGDPGDRLLLLGRDSQIHKGYQQKSDSERFLENSEAAVTGPGSIQPPEMHSGGQGGDGHEESPSPPFGEKEMEHVRRHGDKNPTHELPDPQHPVP